MSASSTRRNKLCAALGLALGIALAGSSGVTSAAEPAGDATTSAIASKSKVNTVVLANQILDRWQAVAEQVGQNSPAWREMFATQLTRMDASVLQGINAVTVDKSNAKASYAQFAQAIRNAEMQTYMLALSKNGESTTTSNSSFTLKLGTTTNDQVFVPIVPCRIVDTRNVGGPITFGATRNFYFYTDTGGYTWANQGGIAGAASTSCPGTVNPGAPGANDGAPSAAVVTVTVVSPSAAGNFIIWGGANPIPTASALNWQGPGEILANTTVIPWGARSGTGPGGGVLDFAVEYNGPSGQAQFVADVVGYFVENHATALDCTNVSFTPVSSSGVDVLLNSTACPAGYTATSLNCASSGVGGDGVKIIKSFLNPLAAPGTPTTGVCRFENTGGSSQNYWAYNTCCRVPGQ